MALRILRKMPTKLAIPMNSSSMFTVEKIGKRAVVGFGINGTFVYTDRTDIPFQAIRFKEDTPEIDCVRAKEKGDWKQLTIEEKKALYRSSFCQTFAEMKAFSGEWKQHIGILLMAIASAMLFTVWEKHYVFPHKPETMNDDRQKAQLKRILDLEMNPVDGIASKWDYDSKRWK